MYFFNYLEILKFLLFRGKLGFRPWQHQYIEDRQRLMIGIKIIIYSLRSPLKSVRKKMHSFREVFLMILPNIENLWFPDVYRKHEKRTLT